MPESGWNKEKQSIDNIHEVVEDWQYKWGERYRAYFKEESSHCDNVGQDGLHKQDSLQTMDSKIFI